MLLFEELAFALAVVLGGAVVMLLVGTQVLDWYWLVLLSAVGFSVTVFRTRQRMLTPYRIAQLLDDRLQLHDSLSTAWFLLSRPEGQEQPAANAQLAYAEALAQGVQPGRAFPFTGQRKWVITGSLAAVVLGLFAVRYLVQHSLDLQASLIPMHVGAVLERIGNALSAGNHLPREQQAPDELRQDARQSSEPLGYNEQQDVVGTKNSAANQPAEAAAQSSRGQRKISGEQDGGEPNMQTGDRSTGKPNVSSPSDDSTMPTASDQQTPRAPADTQEQMGNTQESRPGLLDKMRDAMSNLMSKMRPSASQTMPQSASKVPQDQQNGKTSASNKDQQGQTQSARDQQNSQDPNAQGEEQGQTTEKAQPSQGQGTDKSSDRNGNDAHSGVGRQDGEKGIKEAEQQQAMGKLAEIFGKRSQSVTGDMMVETPSGKQQLKTQYSQREGRHSDSGVEINRDEVPLVYQQYVREYMEQVRKQPKTTGASQ